MKNLGRRYAILILLVNLLVAGAPAKAASSTQSNISLSSIAAISPASFKPFATALSPQVPSAPQAAASVQYYDGAPQYTTVVNCASFILGNPYTEAGFSSYVGFAADLQHVPPLPGLSDVDYIHIVMFGMGNPCSGGTRAWVEFVLPAGVSPAVSAANPIICYHNGGTLPPAQCPQSLSTAVIHSGAISYPSYDSAHGYTWPLAQGESTELQIPIQSSIPLSGNILQGFIRAIDGETNAWLTPQVGLYYFSSTPSVFYPSTSTTAITATSATSSAVIYNNGQTGTVFFDLGLDTSYSLGSDSGPIGSLTYYTATYPWTTQLPLTPNTLYHWRARFAPTAGGPDILGIDQTFQTLSDGLATVGSGHAADCTQAALDTALAAPGLKQIAFNCGSVPVTLTLSGQKTISSSLTIDGGNKVILQGGAFRLFSISAPATLTLKNLELTGANFGGCGGAVYVSSGAVLIVNTVRMIGNIGGNGGAVCLDNGGVAHIQSGVFNGNSAAFSGGAIYNAGTMDIDRSDISGNSAQLYCGGIFNSGIMTNLSASLIANNSLPVNVLSFASGGAGGGIYNGPSGSLQMDISTVSSNTATFGGGIYNAEGSVYLNSITITNNLAQSVGKGGPIQAGGIDSSSPARANGFTRLFETLIAGNYAYSLGETTLEANCGAGAAGPGGSGTFISQGDNLDGSSQCGFAAGGDLQNVDPRLGPLTYNGGWTRTHALLPGSPAIDGGPSLLCGPYDQRGFAGWSGSQVRQVNASGLPLAHCDIGAFEYHPHIYVPVLRK